MGGISERGKEIRRRRQRRKKLVKLAKKVEKANASERAVIATKIRNMTPGAETILANWELA